MYAKVFAQMYDGSLCTDGSWQALVTFQQMLVLADEHGVVDMTAQAIARRTTIPIDIIERGLRELMQPDPRSRTPDEDGKRLLPLSPNRDWGWVVVNYKKYRQIQREVDRREYHREYWHKRKGKGAKRAVTGDTPQCDSTQTQQTQPTQPNSPIAYAEAEAKGVFTNIDRRVHAGNPADSPGAVDVKASPPDCPHQEVLELWAKCLPALPQHEPELWGGSRADHLRARWRETAVRRKWQDRAEGLEYLRKLFLYIAASPFLTGQVTPADKARRPFLCTLEWLVNPTNWAKVHEGQYHPRTEETA